MGSTDGLIANLCWRDVSLLAGKLISSDGCVENVVFMVEIFSVPEGAVTHIHCKVTDFAVVMHWMG